MRNRKLAVIGGGVMSPADLRAAERAAEAAEFERDLAAELADFRDVVAEVKAMTRVADIAEQTMPIMTAYLAGELSAEDEAEVTQALREEPAMRQAFASLVAAWQAPIGRLGVSEAEVDAAYERFKVLRDKAAHDR